MKKHKLNVGDTVTFSFEIVVSVEKDCIYDEHQLKEVLQDAAYSYLCSICKNRRDYDFDD